MSTQRLDWLQFTCWGGTFQYPVLASSRLNGDGDSCSLYLVAMLLSFWRTIPVPPFEAARNVFSVGLSWVVVSPMYFALGSATRRPIGHTHDDDWFVVRAICIWRHCHTLCAARCGFAAGLRIRPCFSAQTQVYAGPKFLFLDRWRISRTHGD